MGKKVEKALSKDKNASAASHDTEDANKTPEPYSCVGNFQTDFTELCRQNNLAVIPALLARPKPPTSSSGAPEGKPDKKDKNKQPVPEPEPEPEFNEDGEPIEPPPKTYVMKDKFEYFRPSVQVELEHADKWDTVAEIYVRGWKIDLPMMETFRQCMVKLEKVHTINFWQVGLTEDTLHQLASFLPQCLNIKNVVLDGNPVVAENWYELINPEDSLIQNLSLKHCHISDKGVEGIGRALGTAKLINSKLTSLNLSGNFITDTGAESIAGGLRMNRTLMSLSLASNKIGDKGVAKIAEALSRFPLSHEEVVERRRLASDRGSPDRNKSPPPSRRAESKDRPGSVRSMTTQEKTKQKPSAKKKEAKGRDAKEETKTVKKEKEDTRGGSKRASVAADASKTIGKTKDKKNTKKSAPQEAEHLDSQDFINPLLDVADYMDGQLWVAGNRILINLNLSRNNITEVGLSSLLKAMQYQTTLTLDSPSGGTGLMRLCVNKNSVPSDSDVLKKLNENMLPKDPFYKPPVTPEGEAAS